MRSFRQILEQEEEPGIDFGRHHVTHSENIGGYDIPFASVDSSHVDEIGYNPAERKLYIRFSNGSLYEYNNVDSEDEWQGLVDAGERGANVNDSKGKYLAAYIKGPHPIKDPIKPYTRIK